QRLGHQWAVGHLM
uniref:Bombesin-like peptide 1 n=2 Tax=Bombina variegata TaxID=8348 RepID=BOML1_BOMVA|nr:RecName: Full=Bombesin-like peptide 1 [Bombina variegata]